MKKTILLSAFLFLSAGTLMLQAQSHQLVRLWETDSILKVPESVLFAADEKVLYVSNIEGTEPWGADGKGSVGKVGLDGTVIAVDWVTGLNAPKGMGISGNLLYVADINRVVVIDREKAAIVQTIPVAGADGLNDISIDRNGVVYVSDSRQKKVYRVENGKPTLLLDNLKGPNGVLVYGNDLYVLDAGGMYQVQSDHSLKLIADGMEGGTDGIEHVSGNDFLVSCWAGAIWYVSGDGSKELLLNTQEQKKNTADIGFDPAEKIVYVPTFWKNSVVAYRVK